ncbi:MAG: hypothetical protein JNK29_08875, partial [Anaerolineales bacterium]|nr:hypothetical protein [Anaerolineales bacterium]
MLPSLAQLQKYLQAEIGHKYSNKAVIGGLPKMLSFWEPNARRDGLAPDLVDSLAVRIRAYPELPLDKRPLAVAELLDLVKEANAAVMAQKQASAPRPAAPAARPPAEAAPRPDRPAPRPAEPRRAEPPARR